MKHLVIDKSFPVMAIKAYFWLLIFVIPLTGALGYAFARSDEFPPLIGGIFAGVVTMALPLIFLHLYGFWIRSVTTKRFWIALCVLMTLILGASNALVPTNGMALLVACIGVITPFLASLLMLHHDDRADDPEVKPMDHSGL